MEQNMNMGPEITKLKTENVGAGILAAIGCSLGGVVLYCLIYQLGYIAGICGLAMVAFGYWGYQKASGKKKSLKGIVISAVIALVMLVVAEYLAVGFDVFFELKDEGITLSAIFRDLLPLVLKDPEVKGEFVKELLVSLGLCLVATIAYIFDVVKAIKAEKNAVAQPVAPVQNDLSQIER